MVWGSMKHDLKVIFSFLALWLGIALVTFWWSNYTMIVYNAIYQWKIVEIGSIVNLF